MSALAPLVIGPIALDFPVVQAALSGYSDWAMRVIARRLGAPYTICEVMLDRFVNEVTKGAGPRAICTSPRKSIRWGPS